jgi:hypothetical protein
MLCAADERGRPKSVAVCMAARLVAAGKHLKEDAALPKL